MGNNDHDEELAKAFERMFHNYGEQKKEVASLADLSLPLMEFCTSCKQNGFTDKQSFELTKTLLANMILGATANQNKE